MTKPRMIMTLAVVAMEMAVMAPASAEQGGVSPDSLVAKGWNCDLDNFLNGGAGVHCAKDVFPPDFVAGGTGTLHLMVFSSPDDVRFEPGTFLGKELLRFDNEGNLHADHAWHGGVDPRVPMAVSIPEPSTLLMTGFGLIGFLATRRRRVC